MSVPIEEQIRIVQDARDRALPCDFDALDSAIQTLRYVENYKHLFRAAIEAHRVSADTTRILLAVPGAFVQSVKHLGPPPATGEADDDVVSD